MRAAAQVGGLPVTAPVGAAAVVLAAVVGTRVRAFLRYNRMHRHGLLAALATMLPPSQAPSWLEEMQAQLDERRDAGRLWLLADLAVHSPAHWWTSWLVHFRRVGALRLRGNEVRLVTRLCDALEPRSDLHSSVAALEVLGLSRAKALRPTRTVPALAAARRLLDLRAPGLRTIRDDVRELLLTREHAHRIARDLRKHHLAAWPRAHEDRHGHKHKELNRLRTEIIGRAAALRAALHEYATSRSASNATVD